MQSIATGSAPSSAEFSPWRPVASSRDGSATFASLICARAGDGPKNCSTQWSLAARLGDSFYFAVSKIVESLLSVARGISRCIFRRKPSKSPCGAARHSKAGVCSATSWNCPARAAAQLRLREPRQKPQRGLAVSGRYFVSRGPSGPKKQLRPHAGDEPAKNYLK